MPTHDDFLSAIQLRRKSSVKQTQFNYGVLLASDYVSTLADVIGPDACNRIAMKGRGSFDDLLQKAAKVTVYSNEDMVLEEKRVNSDLGGVELPKNCLMTFRHILTSSTKDRDGDVLHSDGAEVDPKMLLLWQHVHTLPLGKCIKVLDQNAKRLQVVSCIVDMNQLCHDAAVMVDNDMGRFSHGFRALEFTETKARDGHPGGGFDVTKFEIMEESLVSVPANVDAQTEEVLLSLVEGGKLKSPLLKQIGRGIREHRNIQVPGVKIRYRERLGDYSKELTCTSLADLKTAVDAGLIGGKDHENEPGDRGEKGAGTENGTGASEEADVKAADKVPAEDADDAKVTCPECEWEGPMPEDGKCPECGAELASVEEGALDEEKNIKGDTPGHEFRGNQWSGGGGVGGHGPVSIKVGRAGGPTLSSAEISESIKNISYGDKVRLGFNDGDGDHVGIVTNTVGSGSGNVTAIAVENTSGGGIVVLTPRTKLKVCLVEVRKLVKDVEPSGEKAGRVLNSANEKRIKEAMGCHDEILKLGEGHTSPPARALVKEAHTHLDAVCKSLGDPTTGPPRDLTAETVEVDAKVAMAAFLTKATADQRKHMSDVLIAIEKAERTDPRTKQYQALMGVM